MLGGLYAYAGVCMIVEDVCRCMVMRQEDERMVVVVVER